MLAKFAGSQNLHSVPGFGPEAESYEVSRFQDQTVTSLRFGVLQYVNPDIISRYSTTESPLQTFFGSSGCFETDLPSRTV